MREGEPTANVDAVDDLIADLAVHGLEVVLQGPLVRRGGEGAGDLSGGRTGRDPRESSRDARHFAVLTRKYHQV